MTEIERFESSTGNRIVLRGDGSRWEVANLAPDGETVWTEVSVSGNHPFSEAEARAEFERWRT